MMDMAEAGGPCPHCGSYPGELHRIGIRCGLADRIADAIADPIHITADTEHGDTEQVVVGIRTDDAQALLALLREHPLP